MIREIRGNTLAAGRDTAGLFSSGSSIESVYAYPDIAQPVEGFSLFSKEFWFDWPWNWGDEGTERDEQATPTLPQPVEPGDPEIYPLPHDSINEILEGPAINGFMIIGALIGVYILTRYLK